MFKALGSVNDCGLTSQEFARALAGFCARRGIHQATARGSWEMKATAIREYFQELRASDRQPIGGRLCAETCADLACEAGACGCVG